MKRAALVTVLASSSLFAIFLAIAGFPLPTSEIQGCLYFDCSVINMTGVFVRNGILDFLIWFAMIAAISHLLVLLIIQKGATYHTRHATNVDHYKVLT